MKHFLFTLLLLSNFLYAKADTVDVVVHEMVPLVMIDDSGELGGFEIEMWDHISEKMGFIPNYVSVPKFVDVLDYVRGGKADYGLAGITITHDRNTEFDFSYPHKKSGMGILIRDEYEMDQKDAIIAVITNDSFIKTWTLFLLFVVFMANIIWLTERGSSSIPDKYTEGFGIAMWYMFVVVTTVGFGDVVVKKKLSRFITIVTFFIGIGLAGTAIAQLGAVFDAQMETYAINNVSELKGKKVAVVGGTTSEVDGVGADFVKARTSDEAVLLLEAGKVDAVLFDAPTLKYFAKESSDLTTVGGMFDLQDYGVIMSKDNPLRDQISLEILKYTESHAYESLHVKWFGESI